MRTATATIRNEWGIHCRPSAIVLKETMPLTSVVTASTKIASCELGEGRGSIIDIMGLSLVKDDTCTITAEGPRENDDIASLVELFERHFDFEP